MKEVVEGDETMNFDGEGHKLRKLNAGLLRPCK